MILSGEAIDQAVRKGDIKIYPYSEERLNPNSYNLRLSDTIVEYTDDRLDMAKEPKTFSYKIPKTGLLLTPGKLYLGATREWTESKKYVPMIEGRSSIGRLGMFVHVTAGFGDVGFAGTWTLEIMVAKPLVIYPDVEICQIYFHTVEGDITRTYTKGKYSRQREPEGSKLWKEFEKKNPSDRPDCSNCMYSEKPFTYYCKCNLFGTMSCRGIYCEHWKHE